MENSEKDETPVKVGRPSEYNLELCKEVCAEVAEGFNIKTVLKSDPKYPTFQTWCNWKRNNRELFDLYTGSIQDKAESVDEEIDFIMSEMKNKNLDASVGRVMIDTLKWKASKYYPKMFGDKVTQEITGDFGNSVKKIVFKKFNKKEDE